MGAIRLKIANESAVIDQIYKINADPFAAFKELISNAIDARRTNQPLIVEVNVDKKEGILMVQDNGIGVSYKHMQSLPQLIGESFKRNNPAAIGKKGFGILAFGAYGTDECIISRPNTKDNYGLLHLHSGSLEAQLAHSKTMPRQYGKPFEHGTRVIVSGIHRNIMNDDFDSSTLTSKLQEVYTPLLRKRLLELSLAANDLLSPHLVLPPVRHGKLVVEKQMNIMNEMTKNTGLDIKIWFDPTSVQGKIGLYNCGVFVQNLTAFKKFNCLPWNAGCLSGEIEEDTCELIPSRESYVKNETLESLFEGIIGFGPELMKYVSVAQAQACDTQTKELEQLLATALAAAYSTNKSPLRQQNKGHKKQHKHPNPEAPVKDTVPVFSSSIQPTKLYRITITPFLAPKSNLHAEYDPESRTIFINKTHPNYETFVKNGDTKIKIIYVAKLVSDAAAYADWLQKKSISSKTSNLYHAEINEHAETLYFNLLKQLGVIRKA